MRDYVNVLKPEMPHIKWDWREIERSDRMATVKEIRRKRREALSRKLLDEHSGPSTLEFSLTNAGLEDLNARISVGLKENAIARAKSEARAGNRVSM